MDIEALTRAAGREKPLADYIPFSSLLADDIVVTRDGTLLLTLSLSGVGFETQTAPVTDRMTETFNRFLTSISGEPVAVHAHRIRRRFHDRLSAIPGEGFAADFSRRYNEYVSDKALMACELYLTLAMRMDAAGGGSGGLPDRIARFFSGGPTLAEIRSALSSEVKKFRNLAAILESTMAEYAPVRLGVYEGPGGERFSRQLTFYNFLITGVWSPVRVPGVPLWMALGNAQVFIGADIVQIQTGSGSSFVQCVEIKDWPEATYSGMLDGLFYRNFSADLEGYEFIESQSFAVMSRADALARLETQKRQLIGTGDKAVSQIRDLMLAQDRIQNGHYALGDYSYSLAVFGRTERECRVNTNDCYAKLTDAGFLPAIATLSAAANCFSILPGEYRYRPRLAKITSANFACMAPFHNFMPGKRDGNPWGEALALLPQISDAPYYFNFQESPRGRNSFGEKLAGNTCVFGSTGTGKTALVSFLTTLAMKYDTPRAPLTLFYFDKDHGAEILVRALGGKYITIRKGERTGLNPFRMAPTPANIAFLTGWVRMLLENSGPKLTATESVKVETAVRLVMNLPAGERSLEVMLQNITEGLTAAERDNSLPRRLAKWYGQGDLAWAFPAGEDVIDLEGSPVIGVDGTEFLDNEELCAAIGAYLLHRVRQALGSRRAILVMDEFWMWVRNPVFGAFAEDMLKTIRKLDALVILATQSPSDVFRTPYARAVVEQTTTKIFLANPQADRGEYCGTFHLNEAEYQFVKNLSAASRCALVKQSDGAAAVRIDLGAFAHELIVFSSSPENIRLMNYVLDELGRTLPAREAADPRVWLPILYSVVDEARAGRPS